MSKERLEEITQMVNSFDDSSFSATLYGYEMDSKALISDFVYLLNHIKKQQAEIDTLSMAHDEMHRLIEKDKHTLIKNLIARNREIENSKVYVNENSKKTGELNEFLQQRDAGKHLGKHVIDAVMGYVQELEEVNENLGYLVGKMHGESSFDIKKIMEENKRYRELLEKTHRLAGIKKEIDYDLWKMIDKALEGEK